MESSHDSVIMENLKATLNEFREENILCDAIIKSKGGEHHVHKVLLAAASNFFKTMFLSDFLEAQSGFIKLEDIESGLVEALVEYIYTENIDINASNGFDLYCIADRLEVIGLKKTCEMFLVNNMDISTCLSIMRLAQSVNEGVLEKKAFGYIVDHFQDFSGSRDFDDLTAKELTSFCEQENLNIETEDDLYKAVIAWADKCPNTRDGSLPDIMAYIRFPLMSLEFLEINVINNDRICDEKWNERVFDIYHRTCRYYKYNKKDAFFTAPRNLACYSRKFRAPSQLICITGGWSNGHCLEICECYNMRTDEWVVATQLRDPNGSRCYYGSVVNAKRIYFAGIPFVVYCFHVICIPEVREIRICETEGVCISWDVVGTLDLPSDKASVYVSNEMLGPGLWRSNNMWLTIGILHLPLDFASPYLFPLHVSFLATEIIPVLI